MNEPITNSDEKTGGNPWLWRLILSGILLGLYIAFMNVFQAAQGPIEGSIALNQMENDNVSYAAARAAITSHPLTAWAGWIFVGLLALIWFVPAKRVFGVLWGKAVDESAEKLK